MEASRQAKRVQLTEEQVQRQIIDGLTLNGCTVMQTTVRYRKGWGAGGYGASPGVPDLLVWHPSFPGGIMLGIEVKRPGKWKYSSPGQAEAQQRIGVQVAQSYEDAIAVVKEAASRFKSSA